MVRTTKQFLVELFQGCTDGNITITTLPGAHCIHLPVAEVDKAAEFIERLGQKQNTYYNLALRKDGLSDHNRGGEEDIHTVVTMCADIDVKGAAHKQQALPESAEEVSDFLASLPIQPTYIIESGNGIHALWLLDQPYIITDNDSLLRIISISSGFGAYLMQEGKKRGWKLDPVQDITRMLRAPGTLNFKSDPPKKCRISVHNEIRYPLSAFQEYKAELPMIEPVTVDPGSVGSAERMRGKCAFIDDCVDNAFNLPEPNWHAMISIVAMTEDGQAKAHEWSEPYYAYDAREVDAKVKRAIAAKKPCSCEYIRDHIGFDCPKEGCMNGDKVVRGPIAFAILSKEEQIERLLNSPLSLEDALNETNLALAAYAKENTPALYIRLKKMYQKLGVSVRDLEKSIAKETADAKVDFFGTITLNDIDTAGLTLPDGWDLTMDGISHMEMSPMGAYINRITTSPVLITRKLEDMDDGSEKLELAFYRNHRWKYIILPRGGVMDKGKILKAADMGFPVSSDNATSLVKFLSAFEAVNADAIPSNRSIDHVGWVRGLKEFYPYHMKGEVVFEGTSSEASRLVKSIHTAGDEQTWIGNYVSEALGDVVTSSYLSEELAHYVSSTYLSEALADYLSESDLDDYVSSDALSETLSDYVSVSGLSDALSDYVTSSAMQDYLRDGNYVTDESLSGYLSNPDIEPYLSEGLAGLGNLLSAADLDEAGYVSSSSFAAALEAYLSVYGGQTIFDAISQFINQEG